MARLRDYGIGLIWLGGDYYRFIVRASSQKEAVAALNIMVTNLSLHHFRQYGGETGNGVEVEWLDTVEPGIVLCRLSDDYDAPYRPAAEVRAESRVQR